MKLDAFKQLNKDEVKRELTLILSAAGEDSEFPDDQSRTREQGFRDNSYSSCKQKLLKKALAQPYETLMDWLASRPANSVDGYTPRQLLPNPTPLWESFVTDLIGRLDHDPNDADKQLAYKQVCNLAAAATNLARLPVMEHQKRHDWVVTSHEFLQLLAPKMEQLATDVYTNYIRD